MYNQTSHEYDRLYILCVCLQLIVCIPLMVLVSNIDATLNEEEAMCLDVCHSLCPNTATPSDPSVQIIVLQQLNSIEMAS